MVSACLLPFTFLLLPFFRFALGKLRDLAQNRCAHKHRLEASPVAQAYRQDLTHLFLRIAHLGGEAF
jgi:hypothetical protein